MFEYRGARYHLNMQRRYTNMIRSIMDTWLPPFIRDNRWFMYPFFHYAFRGKNVRKMMEFKSSFADLSDEEYAEIYRTVECIGNDRPTDLTERCIDRMFESIRPECKTLLDVGCGRGYFLKRALEKGYEATGTDLFPSLDIPGCTYSCTDATRLPFPDTSFDVVTCSHMIEHVLDLPAVIAELKRVAKKQLIVVTPRQRYYYYTLDLHIHFFPVASYLKLAMDCENCTCEDVGGDWVYVADRSASAPAHD